MQIKNKLHLNRYVIGTILNISIVYYSFGLEKFALGLFFLTCVIMNQLMLGILAADITGIEKNTTKIPTSLLGALKLLILIFAFYYAMSNTQNMAIFLVIIYIFQLINLVLSIKRVIKKN